MKRLCTLLWILQDHQWQMNVQKVVDHISVLSPQKTQGRRTERACFNCDMEFCNFGKLCKDHLASKRKRNSPKAVQCMRLGLQVSGVAVNKLDLTLLVWAVRWSVCTAMRTYCSKPVCGQTI